MVTTSYTWSAGCGEVFFWPYCNALFSIRFLPDQYLPVSQSTLNEAAMRVPMMQALQIALDNCTDNGNQSTFYVFWQQDMRIYSFLYTLLSCIRALERGKMGPAITAAIWPASEATALFLSCQGFGHIAKRKLNGDYAHQVFTTNEINE